MNRILLVLVTVVAMAGCGAQHQKYSNPKLGLCAGPTAKVAGVPYNKADPGSCAVAISPFDLGVWGEAPFNSHNTRGLKTAELGCKPLTPASDSCSYYGPIGRSNALMMNFDVTVYSGDSKVKRAVLAVHTPEDVRKLGDAWLRGRLNVGDDLVSLSRERGAMVPGERSDGWVLYDVTHFVARAINERRNSVHFEISLPCQTPADNLVAVSVTQREPQLIVEYY